MRRTVALLGALALVSSLAASTAAASSGHASADGWRHDPATGHFYAIVHGLTWPEAEARAVAIGGHLVTVNDAAEEAWLERTFPAPNLWIGFNDVAEEGSWVWASGQPVTYTDWVANEPDDWQAVGGEDYGAMNGTWLGEGPLGWIDADGAPFDGIVEVERRPRVPADPATLISLTGDFDLLDGLSGERLGHASVRLANPTATRLVPGTFDFRGVPPNAIRESHAQVGNVGAWFDPGHEDGANVALAEGVECVYFGPNQTDCHTWAAMFIDVLDPSKPDQVAFAIARGSDGEWQFDYWQLVGKGSFVLRYATV